MQVFGEKLAKTLMMDGEGGGEKEALVEGFVTMNKNMVEELLSPEQLKGYILSKASHKKYFQDGLFYITFFRPRTWTWSSKVD